MEYARQREVAVGTGECLGRKMRVVDVHRVALTAELLDECNHR